MQNKNQRIGKNKEKRVINRDPFRTVPLPKYEYICMTTAFFFLTDDDTQLTLNWAYRSKALIVKLQ